MQATIQPLQLLIKAKYNFAPNFTYFIFRHFISNPSRERWATDIFKRLMLVGEIKENNCKILQSQWFKKNTICCQWRMRDKQHLLWKLFYAKRTFSSYSECQIWRGIQTLLSDAIADYKIWRAHSHVLK